MVNLDHGELAELTPTSFPPASETALWDLRNKACSASQGRFLLQPHQRFLRRVLSPDSPTRSVLVVHGTGTGKTCTAIQVAEEYILRPEFQDKKVLVIASAAVQETFRDQIFDMSRVSLNETTGLLESKQCTGRRYLEMLRRIEQTPKNWANAEIRDRLERTADRIISEFYEFTAYASFGLQVQRKEQDPDFEDWVHATFDNRLLIIDEAHNIRPRSDGSDKEKAITEFLEKIVKTAKGLVLVLLTATPMYESYTEIVTYFNLFLWNERKQPAGNALTPDDFFDKTAALRPGRPTDLFQSYCQDYVSFVKGDSPFSFPFRLPPPPSPLPRPTKTWTKKRYTTELSLKWLTLVETEARGLQAEVLQKEDRTETDDEKRRLLMQPTVSVLPNDADFRSTFTRRGAQYAYLGEPFLGPTTLAQYSAKFARVIQSIEAGEGIAFVYSNYVKMGTELFAMALEEHGFRPVSGPALLANPAYTGPSKGAYALLTSTSSEKAIAKLVSQARSERNRDGSLIRVIISSPLVAEGVDFRCVRQAHILDPWWNMSRIEQVIGRSLRTCSHTLLEPKKQNCTVYLHVVRTPDRTECYDEYTYRTKVEPKAEKIARVRTVLERAAMDCPLRVVLPADWLSEDFTIQQERSEGHVLVDYSLTEMLPPTFQEPTTNECLPRPSVPDPTHDRPLSAILDTRDELLDILTVRLRDKPIWDKEDLLTALDPSCASMEDGRQADRRAVLLYTIQTAIDSGTRFHDAFDRQSILESRGSLYALRPLLDARGTPLGVRARTMRPPKPLDKPLPTPTTDAPAAVEVAPDLLETKRSELKLPGAALERFSPAILNGYLFDHLLTDAERRSYLRTNPPNLPFGERLRVPGSEVLILGYNAYDPNELPIGEDKTRVDSWTEALALKFTEIIAKGTLFASLNADGKFTISKLEKVSDTAVTRAYTPSSKTYLPTTCGTGAHPADVMKVFAKQIDKEAVGIPAGITKVTDICTYTELLAREEGPGCAWLTPQELSVLYGDPALKARMTAEFKKTNPR